MIDYDEHWRAIRRDGGAWVDELRAGNTADGRIDGAVGELNSGSLDGGLVRGDGGAGGRGGCFILIVLLLGDNPVL